LVGNNEGDSKWIPESNLISDNICEITPELLYDRLTWVAIQESFDISLSAKAALKALVEWNKKNSPVIPQNELGKKFIWALLHFDRVPFPRQIGK